MSRFTLRMARCSARQSIEAILLTRASLSVVLIVASLFCPVASVIAQRSDRVIGEYRINSKSINSKTVRLVRRDKVSQRFGIDKTTSVELVCVYSESGQEQICEENSTFNAFLTPSDTLYSQYQYADHALIGLPDTWGMETGSEQVVVAIADTGVQLNHQDLVANLWTNEDEIPNNGIDDDQNGYVDDIHGANVITGSGNPSDDHGHGTHVSGIVGAKGNNSLGVAGVNWNVKLMGVKFLGSSGSGTLYNAVKALDYARENGAQIINASFGSPSQSEILRDAIQRLQDAGILLVVAAGNSGTNNDTKPQYPANYSFDNLLSVAAIDSKGKIASFSNFGNSVHIAAPGVGVASTYIGTQYALMSGTSMAAPMVTGLLALLKANQPSLSHVQLRDLILGSGVEEPSLKGKILTGRRIDAFRALTGQTAPVALPPTNSPSGSQPNSLSINLEKNGFKNVKVNVSGPAGEAFHLELKQKNKTCDLGTFQLPQIASGASEVKVKLRRPDKLKQFRLRVGDLSGKVIDKASYASLFKNKSQTKLLKQKALSSGSFQKICSKVQKSLKTLP
ncbi:MAG: S8 family serine peptidase [Bdellovibrionales bacterium]|nr:S8 family serine peptidase [Bdellovibrionales bacterium]